MLECLYISFFNSIDYSRNFIFSIIQLVWGTSKVITCTLSHSCKFQLLDSGWYNLFKSTLKVSIHRRQLLTILDSSHEAQYPSFSVKYILSMCPDDLLLVESNLESYLIICKVVIWIYISFWAMYVFAFFRILMLRVVWYIVS